MDAETIKKAVRDRYGKIAVQEATGGCGCGPAGGYCSPVDPGAGKNAEAIGYSGADIAAVPDGANLGLGCGNPRRIAALKAGETVLDLGSGAGFDCFLAAAEVGPSGTVIGVDMTPEMVARARKNAGKSPELPIANVEFRLGEIEHLPVADRSVDVIISNCVINLSTEKNKVFQEAWRVLKAGGRLAILDVVAVAPVPEAVRRSLAAISACVGGARSVDELTDMLARAGFDHIRVRPLDESRQAIDQWLPGQQIGAYVRSATIEAVKSADGGRIEPVFGKVTDNVSGKEIRKRVYQEFQSGRHCAEAVAKTVIELFSLQPASAAVRCAAGFGGGIAGSFEDLCGALAGGVLALGSLCDESVQAGDRLSAGELAGEFRRRFIREFGSTRCATLKAAFTGKKEHLGCVRLSARAAVMLADLLSRSAEEITISAGAGRGSVQERPAPTTCPGRALSPVRVYGC